MDLKKRGAAAGTVIFLLCAVLIIVQRQDWNWDLFVPETEESRQEEQDLKQSGKNVFNLAKYGLTLPEKKPFNQEGPGQKEEKQRVSSRKQEGKVILTEKEKQLLDHLEKAIEASDYEEAARLMLDEEERLWNLYYKKMDGIRYLYQDGQLKEALEGTGLVVKKSNAVYYGELSNGMPNGSGMALQAVCLDSPRFDYSIGTWKDGKMEGEGIVGYYYYEGVSEENQSVRRIGMFEEDLMQGEVILRTVNGQEEIREWTMAIENGKIVMDERWTFEEEKGVYQILSLQDQEHAYRVEQSMADDVWFQNLIPW